MSTKAIIFGGAARRPDGSNRTLTGYPQKLIYLQRIEFDSDGRTELRLAYHIIGKRPAMRGRWVWGQFAPLIPADFAKIVGMARSQWTDLALGG